MEFRKSNLSDVDDIMKIITQAQEYFKENGINQWQNNYPNPEVIKNDIQNNESYVLIEDNKIIATTVISFNGEKTYEKIYDGKWITNDKYGVIHRIALDKDYKGLGISHKIIKYVEDICLKNDINSIRVDTHEENIPMKSLLKSNKFKYCGSIFLVDGARRIAFEKVISNL